MEKSAVASAMSAPGRASNRIGCSRPRHSSVDILDAQILRSELGSLTQPLRLTSKLSRPMATSA
jgi:hypothetical protein